MSSISSWSRSRVTQATYRRLSGDLAAYLLLRHHSMVELVDRAEAARFVRRIPDPDDGRLVRVELTVEGNRCLQDLTPAHLAELHGLAAVLGGLVTGSGPRMPLTVTATREDAPRPPPG